MMMTALGRGSAIAGLVLLCLMLLHSEMAHGAAYKVGDAGGWTFNTVGWPKGKRFTAGDTLVFNYAAGVHNVVAVDKAGYDTCRTPRGAKVYRSGNDKVRVVRGQNYFICNYAGHCEGGMKIAINAV